MRERAGIAMPWVETPTHTMTMGSNEDLDDAAKPALAEMIAFIRARTKHMARKAYALCSIVADLEDTQTIDVNRKIHVMLPKFAIGS